MHKDLHSEDDINRLCMSIWKGRGLANIEDYSNASIRGHENYIKKSKEKLFTAVNNSNDNKGRKRSTIRTGKHKCEKEQIYYYVKKHTEEISQKETYATLLTKN